VSLTRHPDASLALRARADVADAYLIALGRAGIAVRELTLEVAPLESLFFMLTDPDRQDAGDRAAAAPVPSARAGADR
jgi:ABC-2 type transport system ATP-binding protein